MENVKRVREKAWEETGKDDIKRINWKLEDALDSNKWKRC